MRQTSKPSRDSLLEARREIIFQQEMANTEHMQEKAEDNAERMFHWQNRYLI